jgi:3-hydroxyisobutyrate dehydrogenase
MSERIGFIGLGIMGSGMARNLLTKGHALCVWNRSPERLAPILEAGATAAESPAALAARSDLVIICVSDTPDVEQVALGPGGVLEGLSPGSLVVDHSSISPRATRRLAEAAAAEGAHWLDAPVSPGAP